MLLGLVHSLRRNARAVVLAAPRTARAAGLFGAQRNKRKASQRSRLQEHELSNNEKQRRVLRLRHFAVAVAAVVVGAVVGRCAARARAPPSDAGTPPAGGAVDPARDEARRLPPALIIIVVIVLLCEQIGEGGGTCNLSHSRTWSTGGAAAGPPYAPGIAPWKLVDPTGGMCAAGGCCW